MREILFRGQTRKLGEKVRVGDGAPIPGHWVYGGVLQGNGTQSIIYAVNAEGRFDGKYPVHSDTISQYTGLQDKNGNKIFEGDILKTENVFDADNFGPITEIAVMRFEFGQFRRITTNGVKYAPATAMGSEVIGNIWDNPELFKEETNVE